MGTKRVTWHIPPPADRITPKVARDWLRRVHAPLTSLTICGFYDPILRPPRLREELRSTLGGLAQDVQRIAGACAEAIATGRSVEIHLAPPWPRRRADVRFVRLLLDFEARLARVQRTRVRGVLRTALRRLQRDARRAA